MSQLTYSAIPTFTDLLNSALVQDKALTSDIIKAIHHNALFAAVRFEGFDMGYFTDGDTIPLPISPVDQYQYSYGESIFIPILGSSRAPTTFAGAPITGSPSGLIRDAAGTVTVFLSSPLSPAPVVGMSVEILNTVSVGGTNFNGVYSVSQVTSASQFQYQQSSILGADTGGGVVATWPTSTTEALGNLVIDSNGNTEMVTAVTGDAKTGGGAPVWNLNVYGTTTDNHVTWTNLGVNGAWVAFRSGQLTFPQLQSADNGSGNLLGSPYVLKVNPSTGVLTSQVLLGSGAAGQCVVHIFVFGQRNGPAGPLTFADGIPTFTYIDNSLLRGGNFLNQTKLQQMNSNAKYAAVRMEAFSGYYSDADTIALPTSSVDGYVYSRNELLYITVLGSTRSPSSYTPGQAAFPSLSGSDVGTGILTEMPYILRVDGNTGKLTCKMYFSGSGSTGQGTVQVITIAQRDSAQIQR